MKTLDLNVGGNAVSVLATEQQGRQWVSVTAICCLLGMKSDSQARRLFNNPQFNPLHMRGIGLDGKQREQVMLPVEELGMWLCTINAKKVSPEVYQKLLAFQKHMQVVVHMHMNGFVSKELVVALQQELADLRGRIASLEDKTDIISDTYVSNAARVMNAQQSRLKLVQ